MSAPRIVVVGSINMDLVARVARLPRNGETVSGQSLAYIPGGKGANQAVAAARLGALTAMCGRVGDDGFAALLRQSLQACGVDGQAVLTSAHCSSGVAWIGVDDAGANAITVIPGANGQVGVDDIASWKPVISHADVVLLQGEIPWAAIEATVLLARQAGVRTVLDIAPVPAEPLTEACWAADLISPNQTEAEQLTGLPVDSWDAAEAAAVAMHRMGAGVVVIKLGELGALIHQYGKSPLRIPAYPIEPIDTTAAGDAFTAALAVAWAEGQTLAAATRFACAAGACAARKFGAQPAMPTRPEVEALLKASN